MNFNVDHIRAIPTKSIFLENLSSSKHFFKSLDLEESCAVQADK